ncbi:Aste57867_24875 [Aphanomyces stellatus]|uniref:Aste57867_24875 protein n=1 Tax=Aphanomyces stellatus TaxID=120398 RepID=A0A485LVW1_9STRA|nr:hypothetical protein As57867_024797 [Aphanomyces stellatus]VFU01509.1 Aste57867_24875 [Aphanomyces stellatus]
MSKHEKKEKKEKKHKKDDKKRKHKDDKKDRDERKDDKKDKSSKKHKVVSSEEVERAIDLKAAGQQIESMLAEFPDLAADLKGILKMVDAGEAVVIGGIQNRDMKHRLATLFPLMGLVESGPNESYSKHKVAKQIVLIDNFGAALERPNFRTSTAIVAPSESSVAPKKPARAAPIGPQRPPSSMTMPPLPDDDDDHVVGPALPGMKGFREASADVEEAMRRQAEVDEALQWKKLRGGGGDDGPAKPAVLQREEWMLSLPADESIQSALGGGAGGAQAPRKFRARDKDERDDSWFAAPADREQALREKAQWEMLGYVPGKTKLDANGMVISDALPPSSSVGGAPIEEAAPRLPVRQEKSLFEKHQETRKKEAAASGHTGPAAWDRERDMASRRQLTGDAATQLIQQANEMSSRFAAPKVTRTFL